MRIIAGAFRGKPLVAPAGDATRPTSERARAALFSMLTSRLGSFDGLRVADLFAGTGALGLEALSRGAEAATFVERDPAAIAALRRNVARCGADAAATVIAAPVETVGPVRVPFDLLFLDPPYGSGLAGSALARLVDRGWVAAHAVVAVETAAKEAPAPPGFDLDTVRSHGKAHLHLFRRAAGGSADAGP